MSKNSAFSLTELLVSLCIIAIIAGCTVALYSARSASVDEGAEDLAAWLLEKTARAQFEESVFQLEITKRATATLRGNMEMKVYWSNGRNKGRTERYINDDVFMSDTGNIRLRVYSGVWQTMTPALTICVTPEPGKGKKKYVTVSGAGFVSVHDTQ